MSRKQQLPLGCVVAWFLLLIFAANVKGIQSNNNTWERSRNHRRILRDRITMETTEIFKGDGTHYTYAYVGTPPQRQSLIIHTASKYTTFPCEGCDDCGDHTDPYFLLKNSNTVKVPQCNHEVCSSSQTYAEGSMWKGYRVRDSFYIGNEEDLPPSATNGIKPPGASPESQFAVNLTFSCQTAMRGLFKSQKENGILGMSADPDAVPWQLLSQKAIDHKVFALCFHANGGIMTIGGVNPRFHSQRTILYAQLQDRVGGLFGLHLHKIRLESNDGHGIVKSIDLKDSEIFYAATIMNPKGVFLDSATTDTYLPMDIIGEFSYALSEATGKAVSYTYKTEIVIPPETFQLLPDIVFEFYGVLSSVANNKNPKFVSIHMKPSQYLAAVPNKPHTYLYRVFFMPNSGAILGNNFFFNYNVIFDLENRRVGFVPANCVYDDFLHSPTMAPTKSPSSDAASVDNDDAKDIFPEEEEELTVCPDSLETISVTAPSPSSNMEDTRRKYTRALSTDKTSQEEEETPDDNNNKEINDTVLESEVVKYYTPSSTCSASCAAHGDLPAYTALGLQSFALTCKPETPTKETESVNPIDTTTSGRLSPVPATLHRVCTENCSFGNLVRGDPHCPDTPWSRCSAECIRSRQLVLTNAPLYTRSGQCNYAIQTVPCFIHECPLLSATSVRTATTADSNGKDTAEDTEEKVEVQVDELAVISMEWEVTLPMSLPAQNWSYVHWESMALALSRTLSVKLHNIDVSSVLVTATEDDDDGKSHKQLVSIVMRLRSSDYLEKSDETHLSPTPNSNGRYRHRRLWSTDNNETVSQSRLLLDTLAEVSTPVAGVSLSTIVNNLKQKMQHKRFFSVWLTTLQEVSYTLDGWQQRRFATYRPSDFVIQSFAVEEHYRGSKASSGDGSGYWLGLSVLDIALLVLVVITGVSLVITWRVHHQLKSDYVLMVQKQSSSSAQSNLASMRNAWKKVAAKFTFRPAMVASFEKMQKSLTSLGLLSPSATTTLPPSKKKVNMFSYIGDDSHGEDMSHYRFHAVNTNEQAALAQERQGRVDNNNDSDSESEQEALDAFYQRQGPGHASKKQQQKQGRWSNEPGMLTPLI